jgi:uracil phosphoribosyltransferase
MAVTISQHPLIQHKISLLRNASITVKDFRDLVREIGALLCYEATANFSTTPSTITCWSGEIQAPLLADKQPTLVPILRAGLGMLDGALQVLPCAKISVVGMKRNEETLEPSCYYENIVPDIHERTAIIIDPMLATGGSAEATMQLLKNSGCKKIIAIFLVAAPEGIAQLQQSHPDVDLYIGALDQKLNEQGYILPGLGDAGDKIFGTVG